MQLWTVRSLTEEGTSIDNVLVHLEPHVAANRLFATFEARSAMAHDLAEGIPCQSLYKLEGYTSTLVGNELS